VERISNLVIQKSYTPPSVNTANDYATVLEDDVIGYSHFSALIAAGAKNDIVYRVQGTTRARPNVWAGIPNYVDINVTADDPENMGTFANFTGEYERIRVQVKNKDTGQNSRAMASLRARMGG
jgi:hypothetical protein